MIYEAICLKKCFYLSNNLYSISNFHSSQILLLLFFPLFLLNTPYIETKMCHTKEYIRNVFFLIR